jgi:hypothetical protein
MPSGARSSSLSRDTVESRGAVSGFAATGGSRGAVFGGSTTTGSTLRVAGTSIFGNGATTSFVATDASAGAVGRGAAATTGVTGWAGRVTAGQAGCGIGTATGAGAGVGVTTGAIFTSSFDVRSKRPDDETETQELDLQLRGASMWMRWSPTVKEKDAA